MSYLNKSVIYPNDFEVNKYALIKQEDTDYTIVFIKSKNDIIYDVVYYDKLDDFNYIETDKYDSIDNIICIIYPEVLNIIKDNNDNNIVNISPEINSMLETEYRKYLNDIVLNNSMNINLNDTMVSNINNTKTKKKLSLNDLKEKYKDMKNLCENSLYFQYSNIDFDETKRKISLRNKTYMISKFLLYKKNFYNLNLKNEILEKQSLFGKDYSYFEIEFNTIYKSFYRLCLNEEINEIKKFLDSNKLVSILYNLTNSNKNTALDYACKSLNDEYFIEFVKLAGEYKSDTNDYNKIRNVNLKNKIENINTGRNDKSVYGAITRTVSLSRNNKVGNLIFNKDKIKNKNLLYNNLNNKSIERISVNIIDIKRFKHLCNFFKNLENNCIDNFSYFIENNNIEIASYLADIGFKNEYYGFNKYYKFAINGNLSDIEDIKTVSIKKKLNVSNGFMLINASFINPNKDIPLFLLNKLQDINIKDNLNRSLMHYAAFSPHVEIIKFLKEKGLNINDYDKNKDTPLMIACKKNNFKVVEYILSLDLCYINFKNKKKYYAIHFCAKYNSIDCLKLLWDHKDTNIKLKGPNSQCIVSIASKYGNIEILDYIINKSIFNLSLKDKYGMTPIMHCIMNYNNKCLNKLLVNGSDYNTVDSSGNSVLHYVAGFSNLECLKTFIDLGVEPNERNIWNYSPLNIAYLKGNFSFFYEILKYDNINVNLTDNKGNTIISNLILDLNYNSLNLLKLLLNQDFNDKNKKDILFNTPMHYLAEINIKSRYLYGKPEYSSNKKNLKELYIEFFDLIFDESLVNVKNKKNETFFEIAIKNKNYIFLDLFLNKISKIEINWNMSTLKYLIFYKKGKDLFDIIISNSNKFKEYLYTLNDENLFPTFEYIKYFLQFIEKNIRKKNYNNNNNNISLSTTNNYQNLNTRFQNFGFVNRKMNRINNVFQNNNNNNNFNNNLNNINDNSNQIINEDKFNLYLDNFKYILNTMLNVYNNLDVYNIEKQLEKNKYLIKDNNKISNIITINELYDFKNYHKNNIFHILFKNYNKRLFFTIIENFNLNKLLKYLNYENINDQTPFEIFLLNFKEEYEILDYLINNNVNFNKRINNESIVNKLCDKSNFYNIINHIKTNHYNYYNNINFNVYNKYGINPVLYFTKMNLINNLNLIIDKIDINSKDNELKTPIIYSIIYSDFQNYNIIKLFLNHENLNINHVDIFKRNIFHYIFIISTIKKIMCCQIIMMFNSFINNQIYLYKDIYGNTPYHYYIMSNNNILNHQIIKQGNKLILDNNKDHLNILLLSMIHKDSSVNISIFENCNDDWYKEIEIINITKKYDYLYNRFKINNLEIHNKSIFNSIDDIFKINCNYNNFLNEYVEIDNHELEYIESKNILKKQNISKSSKIKFAKFSNRFRGSKYNNDSESYDSENEYFYNKDSYNSNLNKINNNNNNNKNNLEIIEELITIEKEKENFSNFIDYIDGDIAILESKKYNLFQISLILNNLEFSYNLIGKGYDEYNAIIDCIKINNIGYAIYFLNNRSHKKIIDIGIKNENILTIYSQFVNIYNHELFELIIQNFDNIFSRKKDLYNRNALHYSLKHLNLQLIDILLNIFINDPYIDEKDIYNNNYLSIFIQYFLKTIIYNMKYNRVDDKETLFSKYTNIIDSLINNYDQKLNFNFKFNNGKETNCLIEAYKYNLNIYFPTFFEKILNISDINLKNYKEENIISLAILNNDMNLLSYLISLDTIDPSIMINKKTYLNLAIRFNSYTSYQNIELIKSLIPICFKYLNFENKNKIINFCNNNKNYDWNLLFNMDLNNTDNINFIYKINNIKYPENNYNMELDYLDYMKFIENERKNSEKYVSKNKLDNRCGTNGVIENLDNKDLNFYMVKIDLKNGFYAQYVFYKMQFFFDPIFETYNIFTNWGRIDEEGQYQITPYKDKSEGFNEFKKIFFRITGNDLENDKYIPVNKKYKILNFNYNTIKINDLDFDKLFDISNPKIYKTKLNENFFNLIHELTGFKLLHQSYKKIDFDSNKTDILNLDKNQLFIAKEYLKKIKITIDNINEFKNTNNYNQIELFYKEVLENYDLSSKFFENFPLRSNEVHVQPINTIYKYDDINNKINNAINIENSIKIIVAAQNNKEQINPIDYIYSKLGCKFYKLNKIDEEFILMYQFIIRSNSSKININNIDIYAFESQKDNNKKIEKNNYNKRLLFHGTKTEHMISIIMNGLLVDVPDSIKTGQMLGNGVYFADMFEKAYNYSGSHYNRSSDTANFVLIAEVTLGNIYKTFDNSIISRIDLSEYNSIKCKGINNRKKSQRLFTDDNVLIPFGHMQKRKDMNTLSNERYIINKNEFLIHDPNRIKIKYIVKIK